MKRNIFGAVVVLLSMMGVIYAQGGELSGTIDVTYTSAYMWRGIDMYPGKHGEGAIQPSITLDLYGTGLGLNVFWSRANTDRYENSEELDTTVFYSKQLFEYETYATNCTVGWVYYDYPDMPSNISDQQEAFASFSWPEICPEGFVPSYTVIKMWKSESGDPLNVNMNDLAGWAHVFGVGYDLPVEGVLPDVPEQILHLSLAVVYNAGMAGAGVDHDWSHAVFGVTTDFDLGNDMTLTPGVYYQSSWEDSVNGSDELWGSVSVKYNF